MQGPSLIIIQNTTYRRTVIQHDILRGLVGVERRGRAYFTVALGTLGLRREPLGGKDLPLDRPQSAHIAPHLHFGAAVRLEHGLGHIAQEVIGAIAMRDAWELRGDAPD